MNEKVMTKELLAQLSALEIEHNLLWAWLADNPDAAKIYYPGWGFVCEYLQAVGVSKACLTRVMDTQCFACAAAGELQAAAYAYADACALADSCDDDERALRLLDYKTSVTPNFNYCYLCPLSKAAEQFMQTCQYPERLFVTGCLHGMHALLERWRQVAEPSVLKKAIRDLKWELPDIPVWPYAADKLPEAPVADSKCTVCNACDNCPESTECATCEACLTCQHKPGECHE